VLTRDLGGRRLRRSVRPHRRSKRLLPAFLLHRSGSVRGLRRRSLVDVSRICPTCEGSITQCPVCRHYHCDDACIPVECARALEET
jgi:hypothetical protein